MNATRPPQHTPERVAATYAKISRRILPLLFVGWVIAYMDHLNVGFAQLQMKQDIGLTDAAYGMGASLALLGNLLFQVPSNLLMHRIGARLTFGRIMIAWFVASIATVLVSTPTQFLAVRFCAGVIVSGFWTAVLLYTTYWYPTGRRAGVLSAFVLAPVVAGMIVGPVSGLIIGEMHDAGGLQGWQWMFLLEGVPALLMGLVVLRRLPNRPSEAPWLDSVERDIVEHNLAADRTAMSSGGLETFGHVLRDARAYLLGFINAVASFGIYCMTFFTPILIRDLGVTDVERIGMYSAIPYVTAGIVMVLYSRHSDRTLERRWHYFGTMAAAAAGFLILASTHDFALGMLGITLAVCGLTSSVPVFWPIPAAFMTGTAAAGGLALVTVMGDFGGMASPTVVGWIRTLTGSMQGVVVPTAIGLLATGVLLLLAFPAKSLHERAPD